MWKILKNRFVRKVLSVVVIFLFGMATTKAIADPSSMSIVDSNGKIKLPFESEKVTITKDVVVSKIAEIEELSIYYGSYTIERSQDQSRYLIDDFKIPGTTNTISLTCDGIVKVGYDLNDIVTKVDNKSKAIYIKIPDPVVNDNYIIWDTVEFNESNSILNPIEFDQYKELISDIEKEGLKDVEDQGIYEKAKEHLKQVIEMSLGSLGYSITYME